MSTHLPLELLSAGEEGRICQVDGDGAGTRRLAELGLAAGAWVRMVSPGRPCILAIGDQRFSLRLDPSTMVLVEVAAVA